MAAERLSIAQRKQIFRELVARQDQGDSVAKSYEKLVKDHSINQDQLKRIEEEGISNEWPPLDKVATRR